MRPRAAPHRARGHGQPRRERRERRHDVLHVRMHRARARARACPVGLGRRRGGREPGRGLREERERRSLLFIKV